MWTKKFYRIAGKFWEKKNFRELEKNTNFAEKPSRIARFCRATPNFAEKTFVNSHKTAKFARKFSLIDPLASHLSSLLQFLYTQQYRQKSNRNKSQNVFWMKTSACRDETLKNQPNKMGMTPQYFHTIPTSCTILPTLHTKKISI